MAAWMKAVEKFLNDYTKDLDVEGVIVCGSYVTGSPSKRSDVDLHIILSSEYDWRERGSRIIDGVLIEYFVNPPQQMPEYFKEDFDDFRRHAAHMLATGKIIQDRNGVVASLRDEAKKWMMKPFPDVGSTGLALSKYGLWDMLDNLSDLYENNSPSFSYAYWNSLNSAFEFYSKYLGHDVIPVHKIYEQLNDEKVQKKYHLEPFPDSIFRAIMNEAIGASNRDSMMKSFQNIIAHVHKETGGFTLDGWSLKTPLSD